jgi:hypothetical protein
LLPIVAEYALRDVDMPTDTLQAARSQIEKDFFKKYPTVEHLPSSSVIQDGFAQSGLPGGSKPGLLRNIGKIAMRNLRGNQMAVDYPKTWNTYSPFRRYPVTHEIPSGERHLKRLQKIEAFAFNIDTSLEVQIQTQEQLAFKQNRKQLALSTPAQKIVQEAIVENKTSALVASVISIQTGLIPSNYRSSRAAQAALFQNYLLDLNEPEKQESVCNFG